METPNAKGLENREAKHVDIGRNSNVKSKILNHFIKGFLKIPHGDHLVGDTRGIGIDREFGQASHEKEK